VSAGPELAAQIGVGGGRSGHVISRYPELVEFRAMLEASSDRFLFRDRMQAVFWEQPGP